VLSAKRRALPGLGVLQAAPCFILKLLARLQRGADSTAFLSAVHSKLLVDLSQLDQHTTITLLRTTAEGCAAGLTPETARSVGPALYAELYVRALWMDL